jgi:hypothetical protein
MGARAQRNQAPLRVALSFRGARSLLASFQLMVE